MDRGNQYSNRTRRAFLNNETEALMTRTLAYHQTMRH